MTSMFALWASVLMAFAGSVTEVTITPMASQTSVLITVDGDVEYRDFTMEGPHRLVVDLMGARHALSRAEFDGLNRGGIRSVRSSQYSEDVVRVVFVLDERLGYTIMPDPNGLRISLQNPSGDFEPWSSGPSTMAAFQPAAPAPAPVAASARRTTMRSSAAPLRLQQEPSQASRISVTWTEAPINDVLLAFAAFSGTSIVPGSNVQGFVTADINDQPWDVALETILSGQGLVATENDYGIIRVDNITDLNDREAIEPIETRAYRISFATATELQTAVQPLLSARGQVTVGQGTNTLVVSDIARVQNAIAALLQEMDIETPQVSIQAKIIFVNRTDLNEFGVTYELKDSRGNQINQLSSGGIDTDGDGVVDQTAAQGEALILLGGNSVAALGNASARVAGPTLQLLTSLVMGRHTLIGFIDALSSVNLSDIEATPQVTVLDNQTAEIHVGELTPIRTIDAGGGAGGNQFPTAQVAQQETGVILTATPHVTADGHILLELEAERSAAELAPSDAGFIFRTQRANTRVLVQDGETVVIAGLTQSEQTETRSGIPLLQDLPVIGRLFRVERRQQIQQDLIILVTPHIVRSSS